MASSLLFFGLIYFLGALGFLDVLDSLVLLGLLVPLVFLAPSYSLSFNSFSSCHSGFMLNGRGRDSLNSNSGMSISSTYL